MFLDEFRLQTCLFPAFAHNCIVWSIACRYTASNCIVIAAWPSFLVSVNYPMLPILCSLHPLVLCKLVVHTLLWSLSAWAPKSGRQA